MEETNWGKWARQGISDADRKGAVFVGQPGEGMRKKPEQNREVIRDE